MATGTFQHWASVLESKIHRSYTRFHTLYSDILLGLAKRGLIVVATLLTWTCFQNVDSFCTKHFCGGHKTYSIFWKPSETFLSMRCTTLLPHFAKDGQHHRTQCCRHNRAVYTRENKPRIRQSVAYLSRELSHLYEHGLCKKLVRGLRKPRTSFLCHLYEQFAAYKSRGLCDPRLIFPHINGPNVSLFCGAIIK